MLLLIAFNTDTVIGLVRKEGRELELNFPVLFLSLISFLLAKLLIIFAFVASTSTTLLILVGPADSALRGRPTCRVVVFPAAFSLIISLRP